MPINIRKLAAIDMAFLGSRMILAEFALGVVGPLAMGIYSLAREHSRQQVIIGAYLVLLGINYIPLLMYAWPFIGRGARRTKWRMIWRNGRRLRRSIFLRRCCC